MTDGSKSTKTARGTWRPAPVDEKNVENESSETETESDFMFPSGLMPCSMLNSNIRDHDGGYGMRRNAIWDYQYDYGVPDIVSSH